MHNQSHFVWILDIRASTYRESTILLILHDRGVTIHTVSTELNPQVLYCFNGLLVFTVKVINYTNMRSDNSFIVKS